MGVTGMAKILSNELGPHNITVNNVAPGLILTERVKDTVFHNAPEVARRNYWLNGPRIPMQRIGRPEELAALVAFLASPLAGYITGTTIPMEGGAVNPPINQPADLRRPVFY